MKPVTAFLLFCIPLRLLLAYLTYALPQYAKQFGFLFAIMAVSFLMLYLTDGRMKAPEAGPTGTWWAPFRIVHAVLYFVAAYLALTGRIKQAWMPLVADALFGLVVSYRHYNM